MDSIDIVDEAFSLSTNMPLPSPTNMNAIDAIDAIDTTIVQDAVSNLGAQFNFNYIYIIGAFFIFILCGILFHMNSNTRNLNNNTTTNTKEYNGPNPNYL